MTNKCNVCGFDLNSPATANCSATQCPKKGYNDHCPVCARPSWMQNDCALVECPKHVRELPPDSDTLKHGTADLRGARYSLETGGCSPVDKSISDRAIEARATKLLLNSAYGRFSVDNPLLIKQSTISALQSEMIKARTAYPTFDPVIFNRKVEQVLADTDMASGTEVLYSMTVLVVLAIRYIEEAATEKVDVAALDKLMGDLK
jgi:hypothetical protein